MDDASDATGSVIKRFDLKLLMFEAFACTMALMAFVAVISPIARILGLAPRQVGTAVTIAGLAWLVFARIWGAASDRHGLRPLMLCGLSGFVVSYGAVCFFLEALAGTLIYQIDEGAPYVMIALVMFVAAGLAKAGAQHAPQGA